MTIREFSLHRPRLASALRYFSGIFDVARVEPVYAGNIKFRAHIVSSHGPDDFEGYAVCVDRNHPKSAPDVSAADGTWWWEHELDSD